MAEKLPMEERLKQMSNETEIPSTSGLGESYSALLTQGLRSGDKKILDKVLHNSDEASIAATVQQLNVVNLVPLLKELKERIVSKSDIHTYIRWLRCVVVCQNSYVTSNQEAMEQLNGHYEVFSKRNHLLPKMLELEGKINFIIGKMDEANNSEFSNQLPLASYQDVSSESDSDLEEQRKSDVDEDDWLDMLDKGDAEYDNDDRNEKLVNGEVSSNEEGEDDDMEGDDEPGEANEENDDDEDCSDMES